MSLGVRIGLALIAPVALLTALALYQLSVIADLVDQNREIRLVHTSAEAAGVELRETVSRMAEFSDKMRALDDPAYEQAAEEARWDVVSQVDALLDLPLGESERRAVEDLDAASRASLATDSLPTRSTIEAMDARIDTLIAASRQEARRVAAEGANRAERTRKMSVVATVSALIGAVLFALLLARMIVSPVRRVAAATRALAAGQFSGRARRSGPPELAALADDFNAMASRLGELDRLKEELLSSVSHDLKAPLASMHETNELLLEEVPGPLNGAQRNLIELNQGCNARLSGMVDDLLDLSRMEAGVMKYTFKPLDLAHLVRVAVGDLAAAAASRRVRIDLEAPTDPVWVDCDETLMVRVTENLLSNALRYSPANSCVRIGVETDGRVAKLTVADEGPGIPDEHKQRIFERFYRVDPRRKGGPGTGIGLAIAKSVVDEHEGTLKVEDAVGGGSRFVIELPAVAGPEPSHTVTAGDARTVTEGAA